MSLSALGSVRFPTAASIRAELASRTPLWTPQHRDGKRGHEACPDERRCNTTPLVINGVTCTTGGALCGHPQALAFYSLADQMGYAGSAGAGKSDLILGVCLVQGHSSIVFRRELTQVKGPNGLVDRSSQIVGDRGKLNRSDLIWSNLPRGASLEFEGVQHPGDETKQQGHAHDTMCFDEATEFDERIVRWLSTWNRSARPGQRRRLILPFNPPGPTRGQWVKTYFGAWLDPKHEHPAESGELRWYTMVDGVEVERPDGESFEHCDKQGRVETIRPKSRTFIRANLDDNAYLADSGYRDDLQALPEPYRSMYLYGDFNAQGMDAEGQLIPTMWVLLAQQRWLERERPDVAMSALGADIARGGAARTVFGPRWANYYGALTKFPGIDTPTGKDVAVRLLTIINHYPECLALAERITTKNFDPTMPTRAQCMCQVSGRVVVGMDPIGVGTSALDACRERGIQIVALDNSDRTADPNVTDRSGKLTFANSRSRWGWQFRESLDPDKGHDVALPPGHDIVAELCALRYDILSGRITLRPKKDAEKIVGHSLDVADTLIYASAVKPFIVGYQSVTQRAPGVRPFAPVRGSRSGKGKW